MIVRGVVSIAAEKTLEDRFAREVTIGSFRRTYFPPGYVGRAHF